MTTDDTHEINKTKTSFAKNRNFVSMSTSPFQLQDYADDFSTIVIIILVYSKQLFTKRSNNKNVLTT